MTRVGSVALKYAAKGAREVQRKDKNVRRSIRRTARTARKETGTIRRWMSRHRKALMAIGAAATAALAGIIQASPALSAALAQIRLGFSLLAMTVGQDVAPTLQPLTDAVFALADAYAAIPQPLRTVLSHIIAFAAAIAGLAVAAATLETIIGGTLVASLGSRLVGALSGAIAGSIAFAVLVGTLIGLAGVFVLEWTGVLDAVRSFGQFLAGVLPGWARDAMLALISLFVGGLAVIGGAIVGFVQGTLEGGLKAGLQGAVDGARDVLEIFSGAWTRLFAGAWQTVQSFLSSLRGVPGELRSVFGGLGEALAAQLQSAFNTTIPDSLDIPSMTIGGGSIAGETIPSTTIGGGVLTLPQLRRGGFIESGGLAALHAGETVVPADVTPTPPPASSQGDAAPGGAGGETNVTFESGAIVLEGTSDTEADIERIMREVTERLGGNFESRSRI